MTTTGGVASVMQLTGMEGSGTALALAAAAGFAWALLSSSVPASRTIALRRVGTRIAVRRGDIFARNEHRVIPAGELFDWEVGDRVALNSLHGQCITRLFAGDGARFRDAIDASLATQAVVAQQWRDGERPRYPIGTTAVVDSPPHRLFVPALSHCDVDQNWKAHASVADLWTALDGLWRAVRAYSNGEAISMPLMGSGLANVSLPLETLLDLTIQSFVKASQEARVTTTLTIVLTDEAFAAIDLNDVAPEMKA